MTELKKVLDQELENVTGGQGGSAVIKTVANLKAEYLPLRTVPVEKQENEIQGSKLHNGDHRCTCTGKNIRRQGCHLRVGICAEDGSLGICKCTIPVLSHPANQKKNFIKNIDARA